MQLKVTAFKTYTTEEEMVAQRKTVVQAAQALGFTVEWCESG